MILGDRLVVDGNLFYNGEIRTVGRAFLVFLDKKGHVFTYAANCSIYGRFVASVDLIEMPAGEYQISITGALIEGNDALNGQRRQGYFRTGYKVTVG